MGRGVRRGASLGLAGPQHAVPARGRPERGRVSEPDPVRCVLLLPVALLLAAVCRVRPDPAPARADRCRPEHPQAGTVTAPSGGVCRGRSVHARLPCVPQQQYGEWFSFGFFSRRGASEEQLRGASFSITFHATGYSSRPAKPDQKPGLAKGRGQRREAGVGKGVRRARIKAGEDKGGRGQRRRG